MTERPPVPLVALPWEARFVGALPGDPIRENVSRQVSRALFSEVRPTSVRAPRLLAWSEPLAAALGLARPTEAQDDASLAMLAGNGTPEGLRPYAARYGGHQFGHWAGQLGDGRAITLGEARGVDGARQEFQLKGAGPTPYSRRADGRAVLRSSLREYLCSEAMHHLGVPTTRALALVGTGESVVRDILYDGHPRPEPGAIVCRVAPTFVRFGNFEILSASGEHDLLSRLFEWVRAEHFPDVDLGEPDRVGRVLDVVATRTAEMVVHWLRVGFVHGVMNTDNMSILGLTIDYGPYGWLEPYDPGWTPNTTDAQGRRYRFGNQPNIAFWNLACLAQALAPLLPSEERAHAALDRFKETFESGWSATLARKLGLASLQGPEDDSLVEELVALLQEEETDYTIFYRRLTEWVAGAGAPVDAARYVLSEALYAPVHLEGPLGAKWAAWFEHYLTRAAREPLPASARAETMREVNPRYVPRNWLAQEASVAAEAGDASKLARLERVLRRPYDDQPGEEDLAGKRPDWARDVPGCSMLSCSS